MAAAPQPIDRRSSPRVGVHLGVHCRRIGRTGVDVDVEVVDLSLGGIRVLGTAELRSGDVVELAIRDDDETVQLTGLVVGASACADGRCTHIAFTRLAPTSLERLGHLLDHGARA